MYGIGQWFIQRVRNLVGLGVRNLGHEILAFSIYDFSSTRAVSKALAHSTHALLATSYPLPRPRVANLRDRAPGNRVMPSPCRDLDLKPSIPKENRSNRRASPLHTTSSHGGSGPRCSAASLASRSIPSKTQSYWACSDPIGSPVKPKGLRKRQNRSSRVFRDLEESPVNLDATLELRGPPVRQGIAHPDRLQIRAGERLCLSAWGPLLQPCCDAMAFWLSEYSRFLVCTAPRNYAPLLRVMSDQTP